MGGAVLAGCLLLAILAMVETATGKLCQMLVFIRHSVLLEMMTTVQLYHLADGLLLSLNPGHTGCEDTKKSPYSGEYGERVHFFYFFTLNFALYWLEMPGWKAGSL